MNVDEQAGITFAQNSTSLTYNVTAIAQEDIDGNGPGYILSGLTPSLHWYQIGIAYDWPGVECDVDYQYNNYVYCHSYIFSGFSIIYNVWSENYNDYYDYQHYLVIDGIPSLNVNSGDQVELSLSLHNGIVSMAARDWNTNDSWNSNYAGCSACFEDHGSNAFLGLDGLSNSFGYFSGLMTEWYHVNPPSTNEQSVVYSSMSNAQPYARMWADEFNINDGVPFFKVSSYASYANQYKMHSLTYRNFTEFSNANLFVTGPLYNVPLRLRYSVDGGGSSYQPPLVTYTTNGTLKATPLTTSLTTIQVDLGSRWNVTEALSGSSSNVRWQTQATTQGVAISPLNASLLYYHQYLVSLNYSGGGAGYSAPVVSVVSFGKEDSATVGTLVWIDASSVCAYQSTLAGSTSTERWHAPTPNETVSGPMTISTVYNYQFILTVTGSSSSSQWYEANSTIVFSTPGVFGRSAGVGSRITSYSLDGTQEVPVQLTAGNVSVDVTMSSSHTLAFYSVKQYQVTLDSGAQAALNSITPPSVSGAGYWYDSGNPVTVMLNGIFERSAGNGSRILSYSVNGGIGVLMSTAGAVTALSTNSISSPQSLTVTTARQYQLSTPTGSISSITSPAISGDKDWYDSGTVVTVDYSNVWNVTTQQSRLVATGYAIDGGSITPVPETANETFVVTLTMSSPHTINVKPMTQYYTSFKVVDATGSKSITPTELQITTAGKVKGVPGLSIWLDNGTRFTVSELSYEGVDVKPTTNSQYSVTGQAHIIVRALVYDATMRVTDFLGFPVSGAAVRMTLANGSVVSGTTRGDGEFVASAVPLGTFTASVSDIGSSAQVAGDSSKQAVTPASVLFDTVSLGLVVVLVLAAIGATILLLRRKSKEKPTRPEPAAKSPFAV